MYNKNLSIDDVNNFDTKSIKLEQPLENNLQDQQAFEELLGKDTLEEGSLGSKIGQTFLHATNNVQYYKNAANTAIKKASLNPQMDNILKMMYKMHDYTKESTIVARVLNKTTQSIDQLTKLQ
jgi:hypothetical protein